MDDSIEIIGVVQNKSPQVPNKTQDAEIIFDRGAPTEWKTPAKQRPVRTRHPVRALIEEKENEKCKKKVKRRSRSMGIPKSNPKIPKKGLKRSNSGLITIDQEPKRPIKAPRIEAGGAGTISSIKVDDEIEILFEWDPASVISERQCVEEWQARNVINLFDQENTLPFIARYRKEKTGNLEVEKLREIQNSYTQLKLVKERVVKVIKNEDKANKLPDGRKAALLRATTAHEVEHLTASMKGSGKRSYAERAKELGLEPHARSILDGHQSIFNSKQNLCSLINPSKEGLTTVDEVELGIQHIAADIFSKDPKVLDYVRQLMRTCRPYLECAKKNQTKKERSKVSSKSTGPSEMLCLKYEKYFNFKSPAWSVRPHQVLAINRGESQKVISVKIVIPEGASINFSRFCQEQWTRLSPPQSYRVQLIRMSIEDSWERLVKPFMQRQIRSQLTDMAEIASVDVFTSNLKKLLLTPPVRGKTILAIDPGFTNGCKVAVTNLKGEMLLTTTIYPFTNRKQPHHSSEHWSKDHNARTLREIVNKHGCELIALGNGTACREMEMYLSSLISSGCFSPYNVQYTIINEDGVSQYSITPEAKVEFPSLDPNHISAVSLCRRLQDPLLEYVKVHPMHLGVGMYQHDIPERLLNSSLDSVMIECVSFVGVDINVASEFVLRKLSGLNKQRAAKIVEYRQSKGPFVNREQIKLVKGIGPRTFEQCAGFVRIMPETLDQEIQRTPVIKKRAEKQNICYLDRTMIHPESYEAANKFLNIVGLQVKDIGSPTFIQKVCQFVQNSSLDSLSKQCGTTMATIHLIAEGLTQPLNYDIRAQFSTPLFRKGVMSMKDLKVGTKVTGTVRNMTHFGAFVDIGVEKSGLIHTSKMNGMRIHLGNIVEVTVTGIDILKGNIGLYLDRVLS